MKFTDILEDLRKRNLLAPKQHIAINKIQSKEIFSLHMELRALFYAGVLSLTAGIGLVIRKYYFQIGHITIISLLTALFIAAFVYCFKKERGYSTEAVKSPSIAFDYILLFGCMLYSTDVAYIETHFQILKSFWKNYLLFSTTLFLFFSYRFDNRLALSLALTTLAAWFGFKMGDLNFGFYTYHRLYAIIYGVSVLILGGMLYKLSIKKHFLGVYLNFAAIFLFTALVSGTIRHKLFSFYFVALAVLCCIAVLYAVRSKKYLYAAYAAISGYIGISAVIVDFLDDGTLIFLYFTVSSLAAIIATIWSIVRISRKKKDS